MGRRPPRCTLFPTRRSSDLHPQFTQNARGGVVPMQDLLVSNVRTRLLTLMGAVVFILLIACANLGNLFRSEEHTSELQSQSNLVCRLLLEKKKKTDQSPSTR